MPSHIIIITTEPDDNSTFNAAVCPTISTTAKPHNITTESLTTVPPVIQGEPTAMATSSTDIIIASLASVIALILLVLMIAGIVLAIVRVSRKQQIKNIRVKYVSSEGGYLATDDGSKVNGGFDNRVVSFNLNKPSIIKLLMIFRSFQYSNHSSSEPEYDSIDNNSISADTNVKSNRLEDAIESKPQILESRSDDFRNRMVCIVITNLGTQVFFLLD